MKDKKNNKNSIRRFLPYFSPYKHVLSLDLLLAALTTVCELVFPMIFRFLTNTGLNNTKELTINLIGKLGFLYLLLRLVEILAQYYMQNIGHVMGARIEKDMRRDLFEHLQTLDDNFYNHTKVGSIMARITSDLFDITEFSHHCPEEFFIGFIKIVISFIILIRTNIVLTLIIYILIFLMIILSTSFRKKLKRSFMDQRAHIGELNSSIEDSLLGVRVVKSFANEDLEREKFEKDNNEFLNIKKRTYKYMAGFHSVNRIFDALMNLTVIVLGGYLMYKGKIEAGDLVLYVLYVTTLLNTVRRIVEFTEQFQRGITGIERFFEIMDEKPNIKNKENAEILKDPKGDIELKNVSFSYSDSSELVLDNISLKVEAGESVAIVGPSGGGKTTICNLIPRFYDVTGGAILIDGKDVRDLDLKSLRENIGMVQQDVYLFSGTVYENIEYGKPGSSKKEIEEAAKLAGCYDFIMELEDGFNTNVGQRGIRLSGGQKQRISIARVFLKNPPILILDEATSALDNTSEKIIQKSIEILAQDRTTITIAHRLSTIRNASKIIVLTEDGIVESGSHNYLMNKNGVYRKLYDMGNSSIDTMEYLL
ncbi:ABC transporter ATP-binding protein [Citroniella saccharovorans]|uniref:ABC transporter ATP-binding protein n=1 Tax=Citroniella saccharovorans TaxID=2053367 RepID=A0AAW9MWG9_9FIRM|nr:ABC transporter ATP-binding protein [Citroniella saccharovorans]MEB3429954.1 ABC transporter ATP-binding protein [Citroniella saccharovorans]